MTKPTNPQAELFKADTTWFHIFKTMIDSGELAKMEGSTVKVYLVVKAHTNFSTGRAFPSIETISEKSGLSQASVKRCLNELESLEYVTKTKSGRHNTYKLREKVEIKDEHGTPQAVATWDYLPASLSAAVADLKHVVMTGDFNGAKIVHIERLNLQVNQGNAVGLQFNGAALDAIAASSPELQAALSKLIQNISTKE